MVLDNNAPTTTQQHLAKDGVYYNTYEEKRAANIRYNQEHLKAKGLDQVSFALLKHKTKAVSLSTRKRPVVKEESPVIVRRSTRQSKTPETLQMLNDDDHRHIDRAISRTKTKKRRIVHNTTTALIAEQRQKLRQEVAWMDDLEDYLQTKEQLSTQNLKSVMRQVEKLVSGEGITYSQWADGIYFAKGSRVHLSDDYDDLYEQAVQFEEEHGRDRGNGTKTKKSMQKEIFVCILSERA
jgi:N-methylhydantoinase A/oxoprolinase/acetone carboxylase beta subunit